MISFIRRFWFSLVILIISASVAIVCSRNRNFTHPKSEKAYLSYRAEGRLVSDVVLNGFRYNRKYLNKRLLAPKSIMDYFQNQAELKKSLRSINDHPTMLSLAFVGDIMWIRDNWDHFLSKEVRSYLDRKDLVFGNLETPIDTLVPVPHILPDYFTYNSSPRLITSFNREDWTGNLFTAVSLANNHAFDRGEEGLVRTMDFLRRRGIKFTGITYDTCLQEEYLSFTENGIRIGFYASSWGLNHAENLQPGHLKPNVIPGIAPLDTGKIDLSSLDSILRKMSGDSMDVKIVYLHWGYEHELYPDPEIIKIARELARKGADIIVGSHPHVLQPNEICFINGYHKILYPAIQDTSGFCLLSDSTGIPRKSLIIYSPGNFTTAMYTPLCRLGAIQSVTLFKNPVTHKIDWTLPETKFVYNTPSDPRDHMRKLMLWDDFIQELEQRSPSKADKIKNKAAVIFNAFD